MNSTVRVVTKEELQATMREAVAEAKQLKEESLKPKPRRIKSRIDIAAYKARKEASVENGNP